MPDAYDDTDIRAELANKSDTDHTHTTVNGHTVESDVPVDAKFTDTVYDDTDIKAEVAEASTVATTTATNIKDTLEAPMLVTNATRNLLNPIAVSESSDGITYTKNSDGSYTLNGTATNLITIVLAKIDMTQMTEPVKLVGCPINGSDSTYKLSMIKLGSDQQNDYNGNGVVIDNEKLLKASEVEIRIVVYKGTTVTNLVFKPMLTTDLDATYDDFVPYSGYDIKTCWKNIVGNPSNRNSPTVKDGVVTFPAKSAATEDTYLRLYSNVDISAFDTFRVVVESINETINDSHRSYVIIKTAGKQEFSTYSPTSFEAGTNKYISNVFNCSDFGNKIEEITVVVKKGYAYPGGSYKVSVFNGKDKEFSNWVKYVESSVHIDSTTKFPLLGLKSFDGETNIISPGNVEVTYAKSDSGKGVLDSLYNKDKMLTEQNDSLSVIGKCKNLLNPTFDTDTHNGITFTRNDDGTYSLSGSRTDTSISAYTTFVNNFPLEKGKYKLTGAVDENNYIRCIIKKSASENINIYDYGDGCILDVNETGVTIALLIVSTDDTSQIRIIKPMITTNLSATYDDFVPYTGDGETLTHDVAEIKKDLGGLTFSVSGTTLSITDGTNTWTLGANS